MLNDKDRELIGIGASIAAGCQPCANFHLRAALIAGASDAEIRQAVNDALSVSRHAMEGMAELADRYVAAAVPELNRQNNSLIDELVAISAAFAVNSVPDLETHIAAAGGLGATKGQMLSAIKIASAVRGTAESKVQEAAGRVREMTSPERQDCCAPFEDKACEPAVRATADERTTSGDCGPQCGSQSWRKPKNIKEEI